MAVTCGGLSGCGGTASKGADATASASPSGSQGASDSSGGAAGAPQTISETGVQLQVPAGWTVSNEGTGTAASMPHRAGATTTPGAVVVQSAREPLGATEEDAGIALEGARGEGGTAVKRLPNIRLGGTPFYHIQYEAKGSMWDEFGAVVKGNHLTVAWQIFKGGDDGLTRAQADKLIQPVMATLKLTS